MYIYYIIVLRKGSGVRDVYSSGCSEVYIARVYYTYISISYSFLMTDGHAVTAITAGCVYLILDDL